MTLQVVWDIEKKEQKEKIAIYKHTSCSPFSRRPPVRSERVKFWTKEEIERREKKCALNN